MACLNRSGSGQPFWALLGARCVVCQLQSMSCSVGTLVFRWIQQTWCQQGQQDAWGPPVSNHPSTSWLRTTGCMNSMALSWCFLDVCKKCCCLWAQRLEAEMSSVRTLTDTTYSFPRERRQPGIPLPLLCDPFVQVSHLLLVHRCT